MPSVFISHSIINRGFIEAHILPPLREHDIQPWYSPVDIQAMAEWDKQIKAGLQTSDWFLVVMSSASVGSEWVKSETHWAFNNRANRIIPVLIEDCDPIELHLHLPRCQYIDFRYDLAAGRDQLLQCWGIDESHSTATLSDGEFFSGVKGPTPVISHNALQRRAAALSGETSLIGASTMVMQESATQIGYLFMSMRLNKTYYIYKVSAQDHELVKMETDTFPPPNVDDRVIKFWSTYADGVVDTMIFAVKIIFPIQHLEMKFRHMECEQYNQKGDYLVRRNFFDSNFGLVELGTRREPDGNTFGYAFFHEAPRIVHFSIENPSGQFCVLASGEVRPF